MYWVYVLLDKERRLHYFGFTSNLERRLAEHQREKPTYKLIYKESHDTYEKAATREAYFKTGNGRRAFKNLI